MRPTANETRRKDTVPMRMGNARSGAEERMGAKGEVAGVKCQRPQAASPGVGPESPRYKFRVDVGKDIVDRRSERVGQVCDC